MSLDCVDILTDLGLFFQLSLNQGLLLLREGRGGGLLRCQRLANFLLPLGNLVILAFSGACFGFRVRYDYAICQLQVRYGSELKLTINIGCALRSCPDSKVIIRDRIDNLGIEVLLELFDDAGQN